MRSAFWRGATILKQSDSDVGQCQESTVASSGASRNAEGFTEVPKNVKALELVIGMLVDKVGHRAILFALADDVQNPPKGASAEWRSKAREMAQSLYEHELRRKEKLENLLCHLDNEMSRVEALIWVKEFEDV